MPPRARRRSDGGRSTPQRQRPEDRPITALEEAARSVETAVQRSRVTASMRGTFQAVALLVRELRARVNADDLSEARRNAQLKRINAIATVLARTAARDASLLALLTDDAAMADETRSELRELRRATGLEAAAEPEPVASEAAPARAERRVVPQSVISRQLANPFLAPDFSERPAARPQTRRLSSWELLGPLLRSFETASGGASSCMTLPPPSALRGLAGPELMPHQAQVIASAAEGHRTFLLADEPGLGKTAQALLAAQAANAYPLLAVVPNVVKTSWAREAGIWTPTRPVTVIHSDGETVDAFSDIVVVNYDILDRHVGWLGMHGFRAMVVDEAHFIKNKTSQRSRHVLRLSEQIRERTARPLLMALTGTPLINDIEDFRAIWQFLGWIGDTEPGPALMDVLERTGLNPSDSDFYPAARTAVIELGIVRRRKIDVAADIPARRIADMPVELEGSLGQSIRDAERALAQRLVRRYESALAARSDAKAPKGIDHALVRQVATWERRDAKETSSEGNVFSLMRRIGQAKAVLAADYTAQLSHNVGKVVFFAKHIDVMDTAEETFARRGIRYSSIRGDQTSRVRQANIDAFVNEDDVAVAVCSLTAAGVGLNLQIASNVVLSELSWTAAEQTQAIDRVHRIGQDQPVTAWRILAAQTIDVRIAELIDSKAGLAARALDGSDEEVSSSGDVQLEALVQLLTDALS
ncbi:MAG TPA: DEAD/DEAH box helicase [Frankiaceae bacterium]|nr:DEAD/DEAH box helicase [Frankiaceae bacterium]